MTAHFSRHRSLTCKSNPPKARPSEMDGSGPVTGTMEPATGLRFTVSPRLTCSSAGQVSRGYCSGRGQRQRCNARQCWGSNKRTPCNVRSAVKYVYADQSADLMSQMACLASCSASGLVTGRHIHDAHPSLPSVLRAVFHDLCQFHGCVALVATSYSRQTS